MFAVLPIFIAGSASQPREADSGYTFAFGINRINFVVCDQRSNYTVKVDSHGNSPINIIEIRL